MEIPWRVDPSEALYSGTMCRSATCIYRHTVSQKVSYSTE